MKTDRPDAVNSRLSPWRDFHEQSDAGKRLKPVESKSSDSTIVFTVYHEPFGSPRMTQRDKWANRECVQKYHAFRDAIRRDAPDMPDASQVAYLSWVAYFAPKPKFMDRVGLIHRVKPDRDNIDKSILDALFKNDAGIGCGWIEKRWGLESKLVITIGLM